MEKDFFSKLSELCDARQIEWDENGDFDLCYNALEFVTESGELGEQCKKLVRQQKKLKGNVTDIDKIKEEIGDVIISLHRLCKSVEIVTQESIDIEKCTKHKFNKTSEKYGFKTKWE